jgi:hypothetical protein
VSVSAVRFTTSNGACRVSPAIAMVATLASLTMITRSQEASNAATTTSTLESRTSTRDTHRGDGVAVSRWPFEKPGQLLPALVVDQEHGRRVRRFVHGHHG